MRSSRDIEQRLRKIVRIEGKVAMIETVSINSVQLLELQLHRNQSIYIPYCRGLLSRSSSLRCHQQDSFGME